MIEPGLLLAVYIMAGILGILLAYGLACLVVPKKKKEKVVVQSVEKKEEEAVELSEAEKEEVRKIELEEREKAKRKKEAEAAEFQRVLQLCREKNINLFDYIAAQTEDTDHFSSIWQIQFEHIKEFWPTRCDLPIWRRHKGRYSWKLVDTDTCQSFEQFKELMKLVGANWFTDRAKDAYVNSAPNVMEEYEAMVYCEETFYQDCKTRFTEETIGNLIKKCIREYEAALSIDQLDEISTVADKALTRLYHFDFRKNTYDKGTLYWVLYRKEKAVRKSVEARLMEERFNSTNDVNLLKSLAEEVYQLTHDYDIKKEVFQRYEKLLNRIVNKILSQCVVPQDVAKFACRREGDNYNPYYPTHELVYRWYSDAIANIRDLAELEKFTTEMVPEHRRREEEEINKRIIRLKISARKEN
jgi:hypothetical protein